MIQCYSTFCWSLYVTTGNIGPNISCPIAYRFVFERSTDFESKNRNTDFGFRKCFPIIIEIEDGGSNVFLFNVDITSEDDL